MLEGLLLQRKVSASIGFFLVLWPTCFDVLGFLNSNKSRIHREGNLLLVWSIGRLSKFSKLLLKGYTFHFFKCFIHFKDIVYDFSYTRWIAVLMETLRNSIINHIQYLNLIWFLNELFSVFYKNVWNRTCFPKIEWTEQ